MSKPKQTDLAKALSGFLFEYLPLERGLSPNTIQSYTETTRMFMTFCVEKLQIKREKLEMSQLSKDIVIDFLNYLETDRNASVSTRNQRRVALNTFFKYAQREHPGYISLCQQILSISRKEENKRTIEHLPLEAVEEILKQPDLKSPDGRRDFAILSLMYELGARVSEIVDLHIYDIRFEKGGAVIHLFGKGRKARDVVLIGSVAQFIRKYLNEQKKFRSCDNLDPLFVNRTKAKMTRAGIAYILDKHVESARLVRPELFPASVHPHMLRHSRAMHWLEAGVDLQYIKDMLGHSELSTTEVYAQLNVTMKREMLEKVYPDKCNEGEPSWTDDKSMMEWLKSFSEQ